MTAAERAVLEAAITDLRITEEGGGYLLPANAARDLADMLAWTVSHTGRSLTDAALSLAEALVIDDTTEPERTTA